MKEGTEGSLVGKKCKPYASEMGRGIGLVEVLLGGQQLDPEDRVLGRGGGGDREHAHHLEHLFPFYLQNDMQNCALNVHACTIHTTVCV